MPQTSWADTTISGTTVGAQVLNGNVGLFEIEPTGTVVADTSAAVFNSGTVDTFTNNGVIDNTGLSVNAVQNTGSIGLFLNTGRITSLGSGLVLTRATSSSLTPAIINAIINSGLISGASSGAILNYGSTIGTLTNRGTIKGLFAIINDVDGTYAGSLGTIENSGLIAGDIANNGNALTISGGTGPTIGTLSGFVTGATGTITSAADIVFNSGNILLNDSISASGYTVTNSGAALTLTTAIGVAGRYNQTAGKLVLGAAGTLSVTGGATLSGGTLSAPLFATENYFAGTLATLVQATEASSYTGVSISTGFGSIFGVRGSTVGNNLLLLAAGDYIGGTLASLNNSGTIDSPVAAIVIGATGSVGALSNTGTLSGATRGISVQNGGQIGTVTNSGWIAAGTLGTSAAGGIANSGTIGTILNDGTILSSRSSGIGNNIGSASIGRIVNTGLLSGNTGGIYNEGTIGELTNSGRILGTQFGIWHAGGRIGTIDNSGTIAGPVALVISPASAVHTIYNSGVLSGDILNGSASVLTISGGTSGTVGTLTGQSGRGTITNQRSNLVFAAGDLLLNDDIVATGRTVSNTGANLQLSSIINLTGAFSQTSGTLSIDPTRAGLIASGAMVLSGGTVRSDLSTTGNYLQGSYTLLSGSSLNLSGVTIEINDVAGLGKTSGTVGNTFLLEITNDYVGGTLSALTNTAAITAADTGLHVGIGGSIGTVTNSGTLGGAEFGVNNRGQIGTLFNVGVVTNAGLTALWNQGSIGHLLNSGEISNNSWAILNSGTIGTIINEGIISGLANAIQNNGVVSLLHNRGTMSGGSNAIAGTFGTVGNSGIIRGNINGDGGLIGTIIGGTEGTVGTFTGLTGSTQGTIGASGNLTFAAGALLLNDTIIASGIAASNLTVSNIGADIALSTIVTIGANYHQTAGVLRLGSDGRLVVTEAAVLSGGTIAADAGGLSPTGTYRPGDVVGSPIVSGGVGSTYAGVSITTMGGVTGLATSAKVSGTNLALAASNIYIGDTQVSIGNTDTITGVDYPIYVASTGTVGTLSNSGTLIGLADGLNTNGSVDTLLNSGLISGAQKGLGSQSTIGTLINAAGGTILGGTAAGLQIDRILGALTNSGYISSGSAGFAVYGSVGTLTNSGTINGGPQGIYLSAVLETIDNSGSITSGQTAINISGSVFSLTNSGYIGNATTAINVSGVLSTLANGAGGTIRGNTALYVNGNFSELGNSGVISGAIRNDSANDLTISGGFGGAVGTLTGQFGKGTITNTLSNLVFASGDLLLDDNIVATGRTVSNTGANLQLASIINLTGAYSQTTGTLSIDPTRAGLIASGAMVLSGGTVRSDLSSTGNYLQGSYTLLSGSSLNLSGATVEINDISGLDKTSDTVGNKLLLSIANDYVGGTLATLTNSAEITSANTGLYVATSGSIGTMTNTGTLSGARFGINNLGQIATLANSGLITNREFTALWNQVSIGQLVNSGTISNNSWAILNSGTIGTIINTGLIAGASTAIQNNAVITLIDNRGTMSGGSNVISGTFGTVANSGVIRGNINRSGGMIGTIIGGSAGTVGTFTGATGSLQGTIGASGNMTFASGALLLNDGIIAAGIAASNLTVSNIGADIALSTIVTIGANYRQTAGLLQLGSAGRLVVSEAAVLSGGTVAADVSGLSLTGAYRAGEAAGGTLVAGGVGSLYDGVNLAVSGSITGLKLSAITNGTNLIVAAGNDYIGDVQGVFENSATIGGATYALYVADTGTVGTLGNSGVLSATGTGLLNRGSIGSLSNAGQIGGLIGLHNVGSIDLFDNVGTIFSASGATTYGILNASSIGTLMNSGLISVGNGTGGHGIYNTGRIDTLVNLAGGVISNVFGGGGAWNAGTILSISNAGLISGSSVGFGNTGVIDRFNNSGTITGNTGQSDTGLYNGGTIGTFTNTGIIGGNTGIRHDGGSISILINAPGGTVGGGEMGVFSSANIGMLSNSGHISGSAEALHVEGTITTLLNAGTLVGGSINAIVVSSSGQLGGIANSGLIRGNIVNACATDMAITGGSDTVVGTFTGSAGHGLIDNSASNLTFGSGAILLDDDIVVGPSHTVTNAGASIALASMTTITGNYSQTDGTLSLVPGSAELVVSGSAAVSGGTVASNLASTANYMPGESVGLITGGAGSTYRGLTLAGGPEGLLSSAGTVGTTLVQTFDNTYIGGTLATLANTGTLSAPTAIYVAASGSLGALANSGTILGDVRNLSGHALTITGGFDGAVGTFTGQSGQGRIVSTLGNVVLASGSLLLDDAVDVGTGTLLNDGASVRLIHSIDVTGNYAQASGTLALGLSSLLVSGSANITGGLITSNQLDTMANYIAGSGGGTLVRGGAGSNYDGVAVASGVTGLAIAAATATIGSNVDLLLGINNDYVGGTLGDLVNSGTITGVTTAAYIATTGYLGTLENSGVLQGTEFGVRNLGIIERLENRGVIDGTVGLYNGGSIGTILNSGTIMDSPAVQAAGIDNNGAIGGISNAGVITGAAYGIYNRGTIGRISNTGTISGQHALYNDGSIGTVDNRGTIAGGDHGLVNDGTIGVLTNSGLVTGAVAVRVGATGAFGSFSNSGTIAGNIENASEAALTISGGSVETPGTLTGFEGQRGTILSESADVVFASGVQVLDDDIVASGHVVSNTGATLGLRTSASITGGYSQTAGALYLASGAELVVSGHASLTGGSVVAQFDSSANYLANTSAGTLIRGDTETSFTGVTVDTGRVTGLALQADTSGTSLVVTALNTYVGGTLGSVTNTGALTADYPVYISSTGSLGSLANSGTLTGSIAAIFAAGTLGRIQNDGVIAGNITNSSAEPLRISGGTGTTVGTLTGFGGGRGTIVSSGGDVVFDAGTIALQSDITATGHTVSNSGAELRLPTSATISGAYHQTSGSVRLAQDAKIVVDGTATLSGGTVTTSFSPTSNYLAGATVGTLVQGGTGSSYAGVTVSTGSITGLALTPGTAGTNLIVSADNNFVGGSLAGLANAGALSAAYPVYIAASGSLGSLTNSGTLSGSAAAIRNLGVIGPIVNTGVIAGNIESDTDGTLAIAGGSGTVFGTLTGYAAGSQGTIVNAGGNLVMTGNILLNDAINVGTRTVVLDGAALAVNAPVAITGNYTQTGGKLLIGVTSTAAYGQLSVSGSANLTGTNVTLVKLGTATLAAGQAYTLVKANGGLAFSNLTSSVTGLTGAFSSVASAGATGLVLTLSDPNGTITPPPPVRPTTFTGTGAQAGGAGVGTGAALDAIADAGSAAAAPVITNILLPLSQLTPAQQQTAIVQLSPTQLTPQVIAVAVSPAVNAIVQHQEVLAAAVTGREERGLAAGSQAQRGVIWGQFLASSARRAAVSAASPYKASSYGVMVGADLLGTSNFIAGGALSWVNSNAHGRGNIRGSSTTLNSFQATGYFTWQPGDPDNSRFTIDGQIGFGYNHYDQLRRIDFLGVSARASYDGQQYLGNLRTSYTIPLSTSTSLTPFASIREVHLHNSGYEESEAGTANLKVAKLDVDSLSHEIGVQGGGVFDSASGRFAPMLKLGWVHTYTNGPIPLTAVLGGVAFTSTSARGARDGLTVGAGMSFMRTERFRIGLGYDGDLRRDFKSHAGTIKMTFSL
ncbi:hypothetical protein ABIC16_001948 [Sphingomonas sp. PvP055]|uniref:hypothetical protein n=1 Tax=Sphingomonas sp. PvP055 TaxID=3156391 RepID=UPI0033954090